MQSPTPGLLLASSYTQALGHVGSKACPQTNGLALYRHDPGQRLVQLASFDAGINPSYMAANKPGDRIYLVNEAYEGDAQGNLLSAYRIQTSPECRLELINQAETGGAAACHLAVSPCGQFVAAATYMGGSVCVFRLDAEGGLAERTALVKLDGALGPDAGRQEASHGHCAAWAPGGGELLVCDLGTDQVVVFRLDAQSGALAEVSRTSLPPGSGPRHVALHPNKPQVLVICEMLSSVALMDYADGKLTLLGQPQPTVPEAKVGVGGETFCAAIRFSPCGKFVYASNRGHDSITVFELDQDTLSLIACHPTAAEPGQPLVARWPPRDCPRDFVLCGENSEWLVAGNQDSDSLVVLARDPHTGMLSDTGISAECGAPVCVMPIP